MRRPEPFHLALGQLRDRLHDGVYPPGARIAAVEVADELGLSATPVREALSRLAGEGLLEDRRGQGYYVRTLSALDIADLYRLSLAHLLISQDPQRRRASRQRSPSGARSPATRIEDPVLFTERLFAGWIAEGGSRMLARVNHSLQVQLGPVRRIEPRLIKDLLAEAMVLDEAPIVDGVSDRLHQIRRFFARRIRLADCLAALAAQGDAPDYSGDID